MKRELERATRPFLTSHFCHFLPPLRALPESCAFPLPASVQGNMPLHSRGRTYHNPGCDGGATFSTRMKIRSFFFASAPCEGAAATAFALAPISETPLPLTSPSPSSLNSQLTPPAGPRRRQRRGLLRRQEICHLLRGRSCRSLRSLLGLGPRLPPKDLCAPLGAGVQARDAGGTRHGGQRASREPLGEDVFLGWFLDDDEESSLFLFFRCSKEAAATPAKKPERKSEDPPFPIFPPRCRAARVERFPPIFSHVHVPNSTNSKTVFEQGGSTLS